MASHFFRFRSLPVLFFLASLTKASFLVADEFRTVLLKENISPFLTGHSSSSSSSSSTSSSSSSSTSSASPHLHVGQTFVSNGVQFQVAACEPPDGIFRPDTTEIFTEGESLRDLEKLEILPLADTLPFGNCFSGARAALCSPHNTEFLLSNTSKTASSLGWEQMRVRARGSDDEEGIPR